MNMDTEPATLRDKGSGHQRLAILGAFGGLNLGDEMILHAAVRMARRRGYCGPITFLGNHDCYTPEEKQRHAHEDAQFQNWRQIGKALSRLRGCDLFIGGGQLIDGTAGPKTPFLQLVYAVLTRLVGGKVFVGGVSTRNLRGAAVRFFYTRLFRLCRFISFRDETSAANVRALIPGEAGRIGTGADLVFSLEPELRGSIPAAQRQTIAFVVHHAPHLRMTDPEMARKLVLRLLTLAPAEMQVAVLPHDLREAYDYGFLETLAREIADPRLAVPLLSGIEDTISYYKSLRSVISLRMHPIIIGACAGAFCVPLVYSEKARDMAQRLGLPCHDLASLLALDDPAFIRATGIAPDGPLPDPALLAGLVAAAEASFPQASNCR